MINELNPVKDLVNLLRPLITLMDTAEMIVARYSEPEYKDLRIEANGRYWGTCLEIEDLVRTWVENQPPREVKNGEGQSEVH